MAQTEIASRQLATSFLPLAGGTMTGELQITPTSTSSPLLAGTIPSSYGGMAYNILDSSGQTVFEMAFGSSGNISMVLGGMTSTLEASRLYMGFGEAPSAANQIFAYWLGANRISGSYTIGGEATFSSSQAWSSGAQGTNFAVSLCPNGSATLAKYFEITSQGDVVTNASGSALATSATDGFLYVPSCAGVPTGTPATSFTGAVPLVYDSSTNKLYGYSGGAWNAL